MLQIFNANHGIDEEVPVTVATMRPEVKLPQKRGTEKKGSEIVSQTLARQLHAETEKRFFLEEAIELLDFETREDSSSLMNVLNLLNRTTDSKQILITNDQGQLIDSSFCLGEYQPELSVGTITWLIDQAKGKSRQHNNCSKSSIFRLTVEQETLTMPLLDRGVVKGWVIAVSNSTERCLNDQRSLFESSRRLLERLTVNCFERHRQNDDFGV